MVIIYEFCFFSGRNICVWQSLNEIFINIFLQNEMADFQSSCFHAVLLNMSLGERGAD